MIIKNGTFSLFFLFLIGMGQISAQEYFNYSVKDGLPSQNVYFVMQDSKGFLWFGTDRGACKFDGTNFSYYNTGNGLNNDDVFIIEEDPLGRIWFGTFAPGLCYLDEDSLKQFKYNDALSAQFPDKSVKMSLHFDTNETIYLGDAIYSMISISKNGEIKEVGDKYRNVFIMDDKVLTSFGRTISKPINSDLGIVAVNIYDKFKEIEAFRNRPNFTFNSSGSHYAIKTNEDDILCVLDQFILKRTNKTNELIHTDFRYDCIYKDSKERIWLGTRKKGALAYKTSNLDSLVLNLLDDKFITHIEEDFQGGLWFCTLYNGVFHFPSIVTRINGYEQLPKAPIRQILNGPKNSILVIYENGDVWHATEQTAHQTINYTGHGAEFRNSTFYDKKNEVFYSKGVQSASCNDLNFVTIPAYTTALPISSSYLYYIKEDGRILDFRGRGIYGLIKNKYTIQINLKNEYNKANCILDWNDTTWVGTINGLYYISESTLVPVNDSLTKGKNIQCFSSNKHMMVMAIDGLGIKIKKRDSTILINSTIENLALKFTGIDLDNQNNLYYSTGEGIYMASEKSKYQIKKLSNQQLSASFPSDVEIINNLFLTGTNKGILYIPLSEIKKRPISPTSYIKIETINGQSFTVDNSLELDYNQNNIDIKLTSIDYSEKNKTLFAWKIEQRNEIWNYTQNPSIYLDNLNPGIYSILLKSSTLPDVWSETVSLTFRIKPPFWLTWWFYTLIGLTLASLVIVAFSFKGKQLKKKAKHELFLLKEKNELETRALRAQMNPHFIFNTLTAIQNLIQSNQNEKAEYFLIKFSHLLRMVVDKSQDSKIKLKEELELLITYLDLQNLRFRKKFKFSIELPEHFDTSSISIPSMVIQPFVENAIEHGISKKENNGELIIRFEKEKNLLKVSVEDNGIGRKKAEELNSKFPKRHRSVGMNNVSRRLNILNTDLNNEKSNVIVSDIVNKENVVCGTLVNLTLKIESNES